MLSLESSQATSLRGEGEGLRTPFRRLAHVRERRAELGKTFTHCRHLFEGREKGIETARWQHRGRSDLGHDRFVVDRSDPRTDQYQRIFQ